MIIVGVDEAGRGPLAGPVVASAVVLDPKLPIDGLQDSKKLTHAKRVALAELIKTQALYWAIAEASVAEIDHLNILQATKLAMRRAVLQLPTATYQVLIDGNQLIDVPYPAEAIVKGDSKVAAISAASILAKVSRDTQMVALDADYPEYGFAVHKGYPTRAHLAALAEFGPTPVHRVSFAPVKKVLNFVTE